MKTRIHIILLVVSCLGTPWLTALVPTVTGEQHDTIYHQPSAPEALFYAGSEDEPLVPRATATALPSIASTNTITYYDPSGGITRQSSAIFTNMSRLTRPFFRVRGNLLEHDYTWTGSGTCDLIQETPQETKVECTGTIQSFHWSFTVQYRVETNNAHYTVGHGWNSTYVSNKDEQLTFPSTFSYISSTIPAQRREQHTLYWEQQAGTDFSIQSIFTQGWGPLDQYKQDYESKKGKPEGLYAHFWYCLNDKACKDYESKGDQGFTAGFNKYMFDYMRVHNAGNRGSDIRCDNSTERAGWFDIFCFEKAGLHHFETELRPGFLSYCLHNQVDYDEWDSTHKKFVENINLPCFDVVLKDKWAPIRNKARDETWKQANQLREQIQAECQAQTAALKDNLQQPTVALPQPTSPLSRQELATAEPFPDTTLVVTTSTGFFVPANDTVQLQVTKTNSNGQITDLTTTATGTTYHIAVANDVASINPDGQLTISHSPSPFASTRPIIYIFVSNGEDMGVGQFAIVDADNDQDQLSDSYEMQFGLSPITPNSVTDDRDNDGLSDRFELIFKTNPTSSDSDGDGYQDGTEIDSNTDPLNPHCRPFFGCQSMVHLPLIRY